MAKFYCLLLLIASASAQTWTNDLNRGLDDLDTFLFDDGIRTISIYSDFDSVTDRNFFIIILPWIVDNIGSDLRINFRFRDSGRNAGPRMCALRSLRTNPFTQAEFLRCEAQGNPVSTCVDRAPINRRTYNRCLKRRVNDYVDQTRWEFDNLISEQTPLILINGRRELSSTNPTRLLRLICQTYGRDKPVGCFRPSPVPAPAVAAPVS